MSYLAILVKYILAKKKKKNELCRLGPSKEKKMNLSFFISGWWKILGSGGIRTHAPEETGALIQRLRPLGHATSTQTHRSFQFHNVLNRLSPALPATRGRSTRKGHNLLDVLLTNGSGKTSQACTVCWDTRQRSRVVVIVCAWFNVHEASKVQLLFLSQR